MGLGGFERRTFDEEANLLPSLFRDRRLGYYPNGKDCPQLSIFSNLQKTSLECQMPKGHLSFDFLPSSHADYELVNHTSLRPSLPPNKQTKPNFSQ